MLCASSKFTHFCSFVPISNRNLVSFFTSYQFVNLHRNINLPVLPAGLQIMADQGFEHRHPVIVLPRANQPQIPALMRRSVITCYFCLYSHTNQSVNILLFFYFLGVSSPEEAWLRGVLVSLKIPIQLQVPVDPDTTYFV